MDKPGFDGEKRFVLATDLDGTFLGGDAPSRQSLYRWIDERRAQVGLIFVSGRNLPFIQELCETTDVPWPDFVIGDVGTTIAHVTDMIDDSGRRIHHLTDLEEEIASLWNDAGDAVRAALADVPGLTPQETPFRYRMSYHYDPESYEPYGADRIAELGHDVLISDNRFFDVLPKGISKGPSLLRLIEWLDQAPERVLVAGDTLNDLSLFETGLKGVAVGNSEPALVERVRDFHNVHYARKEGCGGIAEAIEALRMHPSSGENRHAV